MDLKFKICEYKQLYKSVAEKVKPEMGYFYFGVKVFGVSNITDYVFP